MCPVEMGAAPVYRQRMAQLAEVLAEDDNAEARDVVRGLVETIRLVPEGGRIHPACPAYRVAFKSVLCLYGRSCERR